MRIIRGTAYLKKHDLNIAAAPGAQQRHQHLSTFCRTFCVSEFIDVKCLQLEATQQHFLVEESHHFVHTLGVFPSYRYRIHLPVYCRYSSGETFQGRWMAEGDTSAVVIMVWDNSYSCLRPKTLAYKVCPCYLRNKVLDHLVELWQFDRAEILPRSLTNRIVLLEVRPVVYI